MEFNIFNKPTNDFQHMLKMMGKEVFVNGYKKYGLISNTKYIKENNDKYLSTSFNMKRGDIIFYDNLYWMITNQVGSPRHESYKAVIRQLEQSIIFNLSYLTENVPVNYLLQVPVIVQQSADFVAEYSRSTSMIEVSSEIHVFVQDNAKTRRIIELVNKNDGRIIFGRRSFDIVGVSTSNVGVLDFTCRLGLITATDDLDNGIYKVPANWETLIDDSIYDINLIPETPTDPLPVLVLPDGTETTDVGTMKFAFGFGGFIDVTFTKEAKWNDYIGFTGYKVRLYRASNNAFIEEIITTSEEFGYETPSYDIRIEIQSTFTDSVTTVYMLPQKAVY